MLVFILIALCNAHNWMDIPASRNGNAAATAVPCASGTDPNTANVLVELNQPFTVQWSTNHGGDHFVKISTLSAESTIESLTTVSTSETPTDLLLYRTYDVAVPSDQVTISDDNLPGMYLLQYGWANYRNCATIQAFAVGELADYTGEDGLDGNPGAITAESLANCNQMCADFMDWCSDYDGEDAYVDHDECLAKCSTFPMGNEGDTIGNSLHCRWHHLHVEGGLPEVHCPHSSYNNTMCAPGDYLPGVTITVVSEANNADEIYTEVSTALASKGYDSASVMVTEAEDTSTFVVTITFSDATVGTEQALELNTGGVTDMLAETALAIDDAVVLSEVVLDSEGQLVNPGAGNNANITAAAVCLPLFILFVAVVSYLLRSKIAQVLPFTTTDSHSLFKATAAFHTVSFIVLGICIGSTSWAADDSVHTHFGLYKYCTSDGSTTACFGMGTITESAAAAACLEAAQVLMVLCVLITLGCAAMSLSMFLGKISPSATTNKVRLGMSATNCVFIFLAICLYSAFFYDILSQFDLRIGWAADLLGCWWVFSIGGLLLDYRIYLNHSQPTC